MCGSATGGYGGMHALPADDSHGVAGAFNNTRLVASQLALLLGDSKGVAFRCCHW
jgi:hypothetical protein